MIERALELAMRKAQGAEISMSNSHSLSANYSDNKLKQANVAQATNVWVKVIVNGKLGRANTTNPEELESVVERALALAEFGNEVVFEYPAPAPAQAVKLYDKQIEETSLEELVAIGGQMMEAVLAYNPEIKVGAGANRALYDWRMVNSRGLDIRQPASDYSIGVGGLLIRGNDMLSAGYGRSWRKKELDPDKCSAQVIKLFKWAERNVPIAPKVMPIIFLPQACYVLLYPIGLGIDGKNVLKGESPLAGRIGEKIFSEKFSLTDDGLVDYAPGSSPYDWEGTPRRRREIVKDGVLKSFIYDLETAAKAGTTSTGHGPGCNTSNLIISPGDTSLEEMIKSTPEGLLIESVMGMGQSNIRNGDFSVNVALGYKIENGEIVGRVKDTMVTGNIYEALKEIDTISSDAEWSGSTYAPPIKLAGLSVVAKE